ncbi:hypothetical protein Fot_11821 [Forsythia ovata]|uniref:Uncharacterized protein n=1 Tax=Forsythia ovata TaxID=205694 RepID=A0ABD1WKS3_9LAMI
MGLRAPTSAAAANGVALSAVSDKLSTPNSSSDGGDGEVVWSARTCADELKPLAPICKLNVQTDAVLPNIQDSRVCHMLCTEIQKLSREPKQMVDNLQQEKIAIAPQSCKVLIMGTLLTR